MPQGDNRPVQVTITVAESHADRAAVHQIVDALTDTLEQPEIADAVDATIVTKIKKSAA